MANFCDLTGKNALVTGGSRGIGRAVVLGLAKQGAKIAINYFSNQGEVQAVVKEVESFGGEAFCVQADVSQSQSVLKMFEEIKNHWQRLDILVNNAGVLSFASFADLTEEQWDKVLNTNLKGQFLVAKESVRLMGEGGRIINIASIASGGVGIGFRQLAHYTASKGGVIGLTETMAVDLGQKGINVNAIAPGVIETDMTKEILVDEKTKQGMMTRIPKARVGKPEDIANAAVFLASKEADYITGTVLYVDGGWLAS